MQTSDSLFREYGETDAFHQYIGELGESFYGISSLEKLYTNTTQFFLGINRTKIAIAINSMQNSDGGIIELGEGSLPTMKNAYFVSSIIFKLNTSITLYESYGFNKNALVSWIDSQYTGEKGFKPNAVSQPTMEATAYAIISLKRLGLTAQEITDLYGPAIQELGSKINRALVESSSSEESGLDTIRDALLALNQISSLSILDTKFIPVWLEETFEIISSILFIGLILAFSVNIYAIRKEDDLLYFDGKLSALLPELIQDPISKKEEFEDVLGVPITDLVLIPHENPQMGSLRILGDKYEAILTFEFDTYSVNELIIMPRGTNMIFEKFEFYDPLSTEEMRKKIIETVEKLG